MNDDLSTKRVLVYDYGLFVSLALRLASLKQFASVGFFRPWEDGYSDGKELMVGSGLEEFGVTREKYFWKVINDYDLFVFSDCWNPDLIEYLRSIGKFVWGAGDKASLEMARWKTKELMREIGLPDNPAVQIRGLENLRVYLKEHDGVFVKVSQFRGAGETFKSDNYELSRSMLDDWRNRYGPIMDVFDFVVEDDIPDAIEVGYDGYCIDGEFPNNAFYGWEVKNCAYIGKLVDYDKLPESVKDTNTKLSYHMDGYRQFWSTELREKDGKGYPIDLSCRHASPGGEPYVHDFDNLPEILWRGAQGQLVHGQTKFKFAAQIMLASEWARDHVYTVQFPEEIRPYVKLYNHARSGGVDYCITDRTRAEEVGNVIALGNTVEETVKLCKERAEQIKGFRLHVETDALDKAVQEMVKAEQA